MNRNRDVKDSWSIALLAPDVESENPIIEYEDTREVIRIIPGIPEYEASDEVEHSLVFV